MSKENFIYGSKVEVVSGFYKGVKGMIIDERFGEGYDSPTYRYSYLVAFVSSAAECSIPVLKEVWVKPDDLKLQEET